MKVRRQDERVCRVEATGAECWAGPIPQGARRTPHQLIKGLFVWKFKKVLLTQVPSYMVGLI